MERWADPHTAPHRGLLLMGAGAVLAPQNLWGQTLSWSQPTHSWVTASHDPRKGHSLYHSFAPGEQGPSCVCSSTTELGPGMTTPLEGTGPELVELCCHHPAACQGSDQPFGHSSSRCLGVAVSLCASGLERGSDQPAGAGSTCDMRRQQAPADRDTRTRQ